MYLFSIYSMNVALSLTNINKVIFEIGMDLSYPLLLFYNSSFFVEVILRNKKDNLIFPLLWLTDFFL